MFHFCNQFLFLYFHFFRLDYLIVSPFCLVSSCVHVFIVDVAVSGNELIQTLLEGGDVQTVPVPSANENLHVKVGVYLTKIIELVCIRRLYQKCFR